jgi:hypothetical protein
MDDEYENDGEAPYGFWAGLFGLIFVRFARF